MVPALWRRTTLRLLLIANTATAISTPTSTPATMLIVSDATATATMIARSTMASCRSAPRRRRSFRILMGSRSTRSAAITNITPANAASGNAAIQRAANSTPASSSTAIQSVATHVRPPPW